VYILFDGQCNLCNTLVDFLIKRDRRKQFVFFPYQSPQAKEICSGRGLLPLDETTVLVIDQDVSAVRSSAVLLILKTLGFPWSLFCVFRIFPVCCRDKIYNFVAHRRKCWLGQSQSRRGINDEDQSPNH